MCDELSWWKVLSIVWVCAQLGWKLSGCKREEKNNVASNWVLYSPLILSFVVCGEFLPLCKCVLNWDGNCVVVNEGREKMMECSNWVLLLEKIRRMCAQIECCFLLLSFHVWLVGSAFHCASMCSIGIEIVWLKIREIIIKKGWNENGLATICISSLWEKKNSFLAEMKVQFLRVQDANRMIFYNLCFYVCC